MDGFFRGQRPLLAQQHPGFSDPEENLLNGRSISLVDLQDQNLHGPEAPPRLSRAGSQASVGHAPPPLGHPLSPQPAQIKAPPPVGQPQSAPQARRPLPPSLQPLCFQNPVYHLSNAAALRHDSSSENLSTESSHNSRSTDDLGSQVGVKGRVASNSSLDELGSRRSTQSEECSTPRRPPPPDLPPGAATAVAIPRQSTTAGTAHIVKVEQQSRGGARTPRSLPQTASLRSSSSANTEPTPTTALVTRQQSTCSADNMAPPPKGATKQLQQVRTPGHLFRLFT